MRRSALLTEVGLAHGFGDRRGGVSAGIHATANAGFNGDDPAAVAENRRRFAAALTAGAGDLCTLAQVHSATALVVETGEQGERRGDALVSRTPGLVVAVTTADCVPLLLADASAGVVAAVHAGWRGAVAGVAEATLDVMETLGAQRDRILGAIGPCIRQGSYEVDAPVRDAVLLASPGAEAVFATGRRADRWQFDLAGYLAWRAHAAGVLRIEDVGEDTLAKNHIYFSHRASKQRNEAGYGVQLSGIRVPG